MRLIQKQKILKHDLIFFYRKSDAHIEVAYHFSLTEHIFK